MYQTDIQQYLTRFFTATNCNIIEQESTNITVELTPEIDELLMNRPFYWSYVKKTGAIPNPMTIKYCTEPLNDKNTKNEFIHFGSPKLHDIFHTAQKMGSFFQLYQHVNHMNDSKQTPLHPWLVLHLAISYQCDKKKEVFQSIGIHLISGLIIEDFQTKFNQIEFTDTIADYCFTITPIIKPKNGIERIETFVRNKIETEKHDWADEARQRLKEDILLLEQFYVEFEEKPESYWSEFNSIHSQYEPKINIQIVSGGLVYVSPHLFS